MLVRAGAGGVQQSPASCGGVARLWMARFGASVERGCQDVGCGGEDVEGRFRGTVDWPVRA